MGDPDRISRARTREVERVGRGTRPLPVELTATVVGVSFVTHDDGSPAYPENLQRLEAEAAVRLWRDDPEPIVCDLVRVPENEHDPNAVAVHVDVSRARDTRRLRIGYLPRAIAMRLAPELDDGGRWEAEVTEVRVSRENPDRPGVQLRMRRIR